MKTQRTQPLNPLLLSGMIFAVALGFAWLARASATAGNEVTAFPAQYRCPPLLEQAPGEPAAARSDLDLVFDQETALNVRPAMKFAGEDVQFRRETCFERVSGLYCAGSLRDLQFDIYPRLDENFAVSRVSVIVWNDTNGSAQTHELSCEPMP